MIAARGEGVARHGDTFSGLVWTVPDAIKRELVDRITNPLVVEVEFFELLGIKQVRHYKNKGPLINQLLSQAMDLSIK